MTVVSTEPSGLRPRLWPVGLWLAALVAVAWWGWWLEETGQQDLVLFGSQPFLGERLSLRATTVILPVAVAALGVIGLPRLAGALPWRWFLVTVVGYGSVWAWALSTARGWDDFLRPLYRDDDYLTALPVPDIPQFLGSFTDQILTYAVHVQGHPPGQVVILALLDHVGLAQPWLVATIYVVVGSSAMAAAAVAIRALAGDQGETLARRMLPVGVLAPAAVWIATSPDAFFAGVLAWGVAFLAIAAKRHSWQSRLIPATAAGLLLGLCPFLSYGLLPMGAVALAVLVHTRAWRVFAYVAGLVVLQAMLWTLAGFRLDEGISATREAWELNGASVRPYWYFLVANFVVLATLIGPAVLAGLPSVRRLIAPVPLFVALAVFAAVVGTVLGFMRGEVERIFLPLTPWLFLAGSVAGPRRGWLTAQASVAILAAALIDSPW